MTLVVAAFAVAFATLPSSVSASATGPAGGTPPTVSGASRYDTSAPLRSVANSGSPAKVHPAKHGGAHWSGPQRPDSDTSDTHTGTRSRIPSTSSNLGGIGANGYAPPDNEGAVGPTQYLEMVNSEIAVYSKTGAPLMAPVATNTLWSGFGGDCQTHNDGDGTVHWDQLASRWFVQQFTIDTTNNLYNDCLAVSTSADATGSWYRYSFAFANFPDYPKTGVWRDAYYASFNLYNQAGTAGLGADLCAFDRAAMIAGTAATMQCFMATSSGENTFIPASVDGVTAPPAGSPEWFVGLSPGGGSALGYYQFHVDWSSPGSSTLSPETDLAVSPFTRACGGGTCVPQSGTRQQLDTLADRVMFRLAYRNFGDHEAMVINHSIVAGSSVGIRWYELRPSGGALTVFQQGTYAPDSNYRWMGSMAMDHSGDIALGYSVSSSSLHPGIRYSGRLAGDAAGTMPQGEATVITGGGSQTGQNLSRWGDYTEMTVDPADDCTFWYVNQYQAATGAFNWSTRIASFKFPSCGGTTNDFALSASPTTVSAAQGQGTTTTISSRVISGSAQTIALSASGLPSGATASFNPASITAGNSSTTTFSIAAGTSSGTYPITVTGTGPFATRSTTVTLTVTPVSRNDFSISASPAAVSVSPGQAGGSTISTALASGSAETIQLAASGLPNGATVNFNPASVATGGSSAMTIQTVTSTPPGTYPVTVTGKAPSAGHTTSVSLTVAAPGSNPIVNGTFETGTLTGWRVISGAASVISGGHVSNNAARLGATSPTSGDSSIAQTFTAPSGTSSLSAWYLVSCPDTVSYDWATVTLRDNTARTTTTVLARTCASNSTWQQVTAAIRAGHSYTLTLLSHDDNYAGDPTYTLYDDIVLR
ncbi:MAG: COG1470 family protein [Candidatus Dormibacteria bacterium]